MTAALPELVFRGTTYNYAGGSNSISVPYRCYTSVNPVKAFYYANACKRNFSAEPVIYIAQTANLIARGIKQIRSIDALAAAEEEVIWVMLPIDFCKYSDGRVTLQEMKDALKRIGQPINYSPNHSEISSACFVTPPMNVNEIGNLMTELSPLIKYP